MVLNSCGLETWTVIAMSPLVRKGEDGNNSALVSPFLGTNSLRWYSPRENSINQLPIYGSNKSIANI